MSSSRRSDPAAARDHDRLPQDRKRRFDDISSVAVAFALDIDGGS
jgi:xanthine dehydrogenase iron-sulfur cluster and FAD-binding subunit A